jgi:hypothetical protein
VQRLGRIALITASAAGIAVATAHAVATVKVFRPARAPKAFSITGNIDGLVPGKRATLPVRVRNPWSWAIRVTSLKVRVHASGRACPVRNVRIARFSGSFLVRAHSTRVRPLGASLSQAAPAVCQGATFALTFRGTARRR